MSKIIGVVTVAVWLALPPSVVANGFYDGPESMVFDSVGNRYFVASGLNRTIVEINSNGVERNFYTHPSAFLAGTCIIGNTLYVSNHPDGILLGIDLTTEELVMELPLPITGSLDGLTTDGTEYVYAVDTNGKILKVRPSDQTYSIFANFGLVLGLQTCVYDGANNRLLAVEFYAGAPIKAVSLEDGSVTTAVTTTFGNFDGVAIDDEGYVYAATATEGGRIFRYDSTFNDPPFLFAGDLGWPAGIYYNQKDHVLAVPCFYQDSVAFIPDLYKIDSDEDGFADAYDNCPHDYNPGQEDFDMDSVGNACDNCIDIYNPSQGDVDGDGIGDVCEINRTWYVHPGGAGDATTIQGGIDFSTHGDTVVVAGGLYMGGGNEILDLGGRRIVLQSEDGPRATIIDCEGSESNPKRVFTLDDDADSTLIIDGFTIRGGCGPVHEGYSLGGGMLLINSSPKIKNCIFTGNFAAKGGAVYATYAEPRFINCTFAGNKADDGAVIFTYHYGLITVDNSIIAFHTAATYPVSCYGSNSSVTLSCSNVYGNAGGDWTGGLTGQEGISGNFSADPLFCNASGGYFGLASAGSPCAPANNSCAVLIGACPVGCMCDCTGFGDLNLDGELNPLDVVFIVNFVYKSQDAREQIEMCPGDNGDWNCDDAVNPMDVVLYVNFVYKSQGSAPCDPCME